MSLSNQGSYSYRYTYRSVRERQRRTRSASSLLAKVKTSQSHTDLSYRSSCTVFSLITWVWSWERISLVNDLILQSRSASSRSRRRNIFLSYEGWGLDFICELRLLGFLDQPYYQSLEIVDRNELRKRRRRRADGRCNWWLRRDRWLWSNFCCCHCLRDGAIPKGKNLLGKW